MELISLLITLALTLGFAAITPAHGYIWPNPQMDTLESLRFDQYGYNDQGLIPFGLTPCSMKWSSDEPQGRSNAANWIRNAYNDMATYNVLDGTGGLDASSRFEQDRTENRGESIRTSALMLNILANRYVSVADAFALGAVAAVEVCGGPRIAYRGGRVDATGPNAPGVPEPHQPLEVHVDSFARQGFTSEEMIGLVACGHAFGGVERQFYPEIVASPSNETDENFDATFDTTPFHFDNNIATEYIKGTTKNPLVVGHNKTTNSDLRIFSSDRNKTMKAFAKSPKLFEKTCANLFTRMVDTVPKGVQLTDVIEPLPVKPQGAQIVVLDDGTFALRGDVRFWDMPENNKRVVKMFWADRLGKQLVTYQATLGHTIDMAGHSNTGELHTSLWYSFNKTAAGNILIDPSRGVSKIWFAVTEMGRTHMYDQGGIGFVIQDTLLLSPSSCYSFSDDGLVAHWVIAIRSNVLADSVSLEEDKYNENRNPVLNVVDLQLSNAISIGNGTYTQYSIVSPLWGEARSTGNIAAVVGGQTYRTPWGPIFDQLHFCDNE